MAEMGEVVSEGWRELLIDALCLPREHKIEENGRGGYRCTAGDYEVDWTSEDQKRIKRHVMGFVADAIIETGMIDPHAVGGW